MKNWLIAVGCIVALGVAQAQDSPPPAAGKGGAREACKADVDKFCSDVKSGGGRIIACMKQHKDELSQPCKDAIDHGHKGPPPGGDQAPPK
jgi:hypothetical protein